MKRCKYAFQLCELKRAGCPLDGDFRRWDELRAVGKAAQGCGHRVRQLPTKVWWGLPAEAQLVYDEDRKVYVVEKGGEEGDVETHSTGNGPGGVHFGAGGTDEPAGK